MLTSRMQEHTTVDAYIAAQPPERQAKLEQLRNVICKAAPKAKEGISYGMPAYKLHSPLAYFANFKNHYSLFAMPAAVDAFKDELADYETSKGTIRFTHDKPLPVKLISAIIKFRVKQNEEKAALKAKAKKTTSRA